MTRRRLGGRRQRPDLLGGEREGRALPQRRRARGVSGRPSARDASPRSSAPASSVPARDGSIPTSRATLRRAAPREERDRGVGVVVVEDAADELRERPRAAAGREREDGAWRVEVGERRPRRRARARQLAASSEGRSGARAASAAASRGRASGATSGSQPGGPTTSSVEPPPTSTTPTVLGGSPEMRRHGAVVGEPALVVRGEDPDGQARRARGGLATSAADAAPWRPGAVTITCARSTPSSRARSAYFRQTRAAAAIVLRRSVPVSAISAPRPRYARAVATGSSRVRVDVRDQQARRVRPDVEDRRPACLDDPDRTGRPASMW